jgi:hypothetical protein
MSTRTAVPVLSAKAFWISELAPNVNPGRGREVCSFHSPNQPICNALGSLEVRAELKGLGRGVGEKMPAIRSEHLQFRVEAPLWRILNRSARERAGVGSRWCG